MFRVPSVEGARDTGVREVLRAQCLVFFKRKFFSDDFRKSWKKDLRRGSQYAPSPIPSIESSGKEVGTINEGGEGLVLSVNFPVSKKYLEKVLTEWSPNFLLKLFP